MTPEEYLAQSKYAPFKGSIPMIPMGNCHPFIKDGELYCTGSIIYNHIKYDFIKVNMDGRILIGLPNYIEYQIQKPNYLYQIWKRLDEFFNELIIFAEFPDQNRELVNLRINVNLIYQLPLPKEDKLQWADWIKELYWNRKVLLNEWYIKYVLPF